MSCSSLRKPRAPGRARALLLLAIVKLDVD